MPIGVEQWRASIGLFHSGSRRQLVCAPDEREPAPIPDEKQLAPTPVLETLYVVLALSVLLGGLTCIVGSTAINSGQLSTSSPQLLLLGGALTTNTTEAHSVSLERSARAKAILLIIAGDVELNPGPLPPASASPESKALRQHFATLVTAVTDPLMLSLKLFSTGMIDMATKDKANLPTMTNYMKNDVLLSAVMSRVDTDPNLFHRFVELLKDDGDDILKSLGGKLEDTYKEFAKEDTERYTLNPPPAEQSELSQSHIGTQPEHSPPHPKRQPEHSPLLPTKQPEHSPPPFTRQPEHSPLPLQFQFFISFLRSFYDSEVPLCFCKWPPVPKKKFINLAAIGRKEVTSAELKQFMLDTLHGNVDQILKTKAPIRVEDILNIRQGEMLHCVLIEGAPGVGKTTLSWEICKRWARGELFQQYAAIMLLRLRDRPVQNAQTIRDLVCYMYDNEDEDSRTNISQHMIQTKGKHTLIILEGLDELPKLLSIDQPSIFTRLLSRNILPDATILVTSRPSATAQLRKGWEISRHIEILGFTEKDITDYFQNALPPQELPAFDSYLSTYPDIRLTMYIPLNCAIVVEVYRSCQQSSRPPPKTTTELYTCLVQTILQRYLASHPDYKNNTTDVDKFTDLPPPVYHHFYKLIQMAYDGVQNQQLIFQDRHKPMEDLGFMDTVTELFSTKHSVSYSYNFLHLSLQEYLGAYYISLKSVDEQLQLLRTIFWKQHLRNMGQFLAGITKYQGIDRATVKAVIECQERWDGQLKLSPYTLQLLHESGDYSIIDGYPSYYCQLTDYSPLLDFAVLAHCIASSSYKWTLVLGEPTGRSQRMQSTKRIDMFVQTLNSHSNPSYIIEAITCYYDAPECVQHLLLELPQHALQHIQELNISSNFRNPQPLPLPLLEYILSKMSRLHTLWLNDGAVSTTGGAALAQLIINNNTIGHVALCWNAISAEGREALEKIKEIKKDLELRISQ